MKKTAVNDEDFLLHYVSSDKKKDDEDKPPISNEEKEKRALAMEKYTWGVMTGKALPKSKKKVRKKNGPNPHSPKSGRKVKS